MFRRESKPDTFDRQMDALRGQLGDETPYAEEPVEERLPQTDELTASPVPQATQERPRDYGFGQGSLAQSPTPYRTPPAPEPEAPAVPSIPIVDATTTVIAQDAQWKGDITSEGSVHIHGRFEGSVRARVAILVAEGAEVDAALASDSIVVAGTSKGSIRAQSRFEVLPSGRVAGDIVSPTLVVHEGAVMAGQLRMSPGEAAPEVAPAPTPVVQRRAARGTA